MNPSERFVCIHSHFYQPPRENPWLEEIELQDSAYPYHDWNERITAECYAPNTSARILNGAGQIEQIVNNYARTSFNFGPTLLSWMQAKTPQVYEAILAADRESQKRFGGHGSAIAQCYNHIIMPLASRRDKQTQVIWGVRDFEQRFGRAPEGIWLPETAVDVETLEVLAERGLTFTILAPHQAARVRRLPTPRQGTAVDAGRAHAHTQEHAEQAEALEEHHWHDVGGGRIDPTMAYRCNLPSGRSIALFFYDGPISRGVAFEGLLNKGEYLAHRLLGAFADGRDWPQLVHIATDGETYGHHHRYGDMALAYALEYIETNKLARLTNYGQYLELFPPTHEVEIVENTSWSCAHMIERWRSHCGCNSGGYPGWNQEWRTPLRQALDWLRDTLEAPYEELGRTLFKDPWKARNDYVEVVLDRSPENVNWFLARQAQGQLDEEERIFALKLLELQRQMMLMYTSCGWFFDELSGIETVQVMQYASRAIQLAAELFEQDLEPLFLQRLELARSNIPDHGTGARIYEKFVRPGTVDLPRVGAHYAMSSLFDDYEEQATIYAYQVNRQDYHRLEAGRARLVVGRAHIGSLVTHEAAELCFAVVHFGDHNLSGGVKLYEDDEQYQELRQELADAFERADLPGVLRLFDYYFPHSYSLKSLFRDEQRRILDQILRTTIAETDAAYYQLYESHAPLMRFLTDLGIPQPRSFKVAAEFAINSALRVELQLDEPDLKRIAALQKEARRVGVELDTQSLAYVLKQTLDQAMAELQDHPADLPQLQRVETLVSLARTLPFDVSFWKSQNIYYELLKTAYPKMRRKAQRKDEAARAWVGHFGSLGKHLGVTFS